MIAINPPAPNLGRVNAILAGTSRRYRSEPFAGPLSIKSVVRGRARWEIAGGSFELTPGTALILGDGIDYAVEIDASDPVETFCLFFERGYVESACRALTESDTNLLDDPARAVQVEFGPRLTFDDTLLSLLDEGRACREQNQLASVFERAAFALAQQRCAPRSIPASRASTREEVLRRVERGTAFMHANLARPVALGEIASAACMSPFHFHRMFRSVHGLPPHRYLTRLRLERSRAMLARTDLTITEVAAACGFESLGSFTTLFTRETGVPPGVFRRNREAQGGGRR